MEETVCNTQMGRLETIQVEYTKENTTWFDECTKQDIYRITDFKGGLLIKENDYTYPVWVYGVSRLDINNDQGKAKEIKTQCLEG